MIGSIRGELLDESAGELLVEVNGIGYRLQVTPNTIGQLGVDRGGEVFLYVHHHIREDAQIFFGFPSSDERSVFETLIATHGVGPSLALAILSVHSPLALRQIIASEDSASMCLVPGVGKKTAARLMVELKSKLGDPSSVSPVGQVVGQPGSSGNVKTDVRDALAGLGYGIDEISGALSDLPNDVGSSDLLRQALQRLAVA